MMLSSKKILLGVTGGIAAYKSAELVRQLRKQGAEVRVVMTKAGQEFVTPLTFQALSGHPVLIDGNNAESEFAMDHIAAARWAEVILVAPATADFMAKLAHGFANDLLSTLCLATNAPIIVAPAMNQQMWLNAATQENLEKLTARGIHFWGPAEGEQACGEVGAGRMMESETILQQLEDFFAPKIFAGKKVVITAGPTQEAIDPVRYLSNRSSGKMGYALAETAAKLGAKVVLISGPTHLKTPCGVEKIAITTAEEMQNAVAKNLEGCEIFIAAAAVADYRVKEIASQKIKKHAESFALDLVRNTDILSWVAAQKQKPFVVGFAAETENVLENARKKLHDKKLDMIIANDVSDPTIGFDSENNAVTAIWAEGQREFSVRSKRELAGELLGLVFSVRNKSPLPRAAWERVPLKGAGEGV